MKNRTQNVKEKPAAESFIKNQNWGYLWISSLESYTVFIVCSSGGLPKYIKNLSSDHMLLTYIKVFKETKRGMDLVFPHHFLHDFLWKIFFILYSIKRLNFIGWLPLLLKILGKMYVAIVCYTVCDVTNFKIKLSFLVKPFS